jgi:hypothetical protein
MTVVPLPDIPCVRIQLGYTTVTSTKMGNRIYFSYTGGPPSGADLNSLATAIEGAWAAHLASLVNNEMSLTNVVVEDIASYTGSTGAWSGISGGTRSGTQPPLQLAFNLQYQIARRYRGGKPKGYWPFGVDADMANAGQWSGTLASAVQSQFGAFITALGGLSEPSIALANHVNLSFKHLFTNITNSSGREHAVPTYRATALHDLVVSYIAHLEISSQRRRRVASTL